MQTAYKIFKNMAVNDILLILKYAIISNINLKVNYAVRY